MNSSGATQAGQTAPGERPRRSARVIFCTTVLTLEAFVVLFATLVGIGLDLGEPALVWAVGGVSALACLVLAGLARHRIGRILGSVMQGLLIASGLIIPMMVVVGIIFAVIWVVALRLGRRIDVERAECDEAERAGAAPAQDQPAGGTDAG
ncbi:DUF4233 domain-containing protein [Pseudactinotalea sp. Z1748]|uniref:DUF4233 domain-containing protein n=1 Tax=Pseudactinotalea sp. Z1748 TaxID=3413027 RepID=UPI003C7A67CC